MTSAIDITHPYTIKNEKSGVVHIFFPSGTTDGEPDGGCTGHTRCGIYIFDTVAQWELGQDKIICKNCLSPGHSNLWADERWWDYELF